MSFTTPILFTPKNEVQRREFVKWIDMLGYRLFQSVKNGWGETLRTNVDMAICSVHTEVSSMFKLRIDCGSNLELAKALAALRDDYDYMQWFISEWDKEWYLYNNDNSTFIDSQSDMRKATPRELIERFKI